MGEWETLGIGGLARESNFVARDRICPYFSVLGRIYQIAVRR